MCSQSMVTQSKTQLKSASIRNTNVGRSQTLQKVTTMNLEPAPICSKTQQFDADFNPSCIITLPSFQSKASPVAAKAAVKKAPVMVLQGKKWNIVSFKLTLFPIHHPLGSGMKYCVRSLCYNLCLFT